LDHISRSLYPDVLSDKTPRNKKFSLRGYSLLKKGVDEKVKIEGKICLITELLRRWKERPCYSKDSRIIFKQKPRPKIKIPKPKRNKYCPR